MTILTQSKEEEVVLAGRVWLDRHILVRGKGRMKGRASHRRAGLIPASDAQRPTVIEFLGISGAGKTTLAATAIERLREQNGPVYTLDEATRLAFLGSTKDRFWRSAQRLIPRQISRRFWHHAFNRSQDRFLEVRDVMVDNGETVEVIAAATRRRRSFEIRSDAVVGWCLGSLVAHRMAVRALQNPATVIADEGLVNRAVSLFGFQFSEADRNDLERYLRSIPMPDLVVHVDTTPHVAEQRIKTWSRRFTDEDEATRRAFLEGSERCVAAIVQILDAQEVPTVHIPGPDGPIAENVASLMEALDSLDRH